MRKAVVFFTFVFFILLFLPLTIDARSGCCSWHGGVCGCRCCDGTPLSATCAPYYPGCSGGGQIVPTQVEQIYSPPTNTPKPLPTSTPYPTYIKPTSIPIPTNTPTLIPTKISSPTLTFIPKPTLASAFGNLKTSSLRINSMITPSLKPLPTLTLSVCGETDCVKVCSKIGKTCSTQDWMRSGCVGKVKLLSCTMIYPTPTIVSINTITPTKNLTIIPSSVPAVKGISVRRPVFNFWSWFRSIFN
ncbi:MAG: hypothetical protein V1922_01365 [bacterium]